MVVTINCYTGYDYIDLISFPAANTNVRFDFDSGSAVAPKHFISYLKTAFPIGGILADDVGLGYLSLVSSFGYLAIQYQHVGKQ